MPLSAILRYAVFIKKNTENEAKEQKKNIAFSRRKHG